MRPTAPSTFAGAKALIGGRALAVWALLALLLVAFSALAAHRMALRAGLQAAMLEAEHRLDLIASALHGQLARFDFLPSLLEVTPSVLELLDAPSDPRLRDQVNRYLSGINATAGAEMLYVLDPRGVALAAADWNLPGTTVGNDFSFRPYVQEALATGRGRFYGVGITSKLPGYYLSYALSSGGLTRGIATSSSTPTTARSFSTRSRACRWRSRSSSCAPCRNAASSGSAPTIRSGSTAASSRRARTT